jgi:hypothetical protein
VGQCLLLAILISYLNVRAVGPWLRPLLVAVAIGAVYCLAARGHARIAEIGVALALGCMAYAQGSQGTSFRFSADESSLPKGAADFILAHHITGPMLNNYHQGGYLIWKLWPQERVFIDGRALNETAFIDADRMQTADSKGGEDPSRLLNDYGIEVILMSGFEFVSGTPYALVPALAAMPQTEWKLVYQDYISVVFMRHPPSDVKPMDRAYAFTSMASQCEFHMQYYPGQCRCAASLSKLFQALGYQAEARKWLRLWVEQKQESDPDSERAYQLMMGR